MASPLLAQTAGVLGLFLQVSALGAIAAWQIAAPHPAQARQIIVSKDTPVTNHNRNAIDPDKLLTELSATWLAGLPAAELEVGRRLLREIVTDWAREANTDREPQDVLVILKRDFESLRQDKGPAARLETLREVAAERAINRLSVETFALGKQLVAHKLDAAEGRKRGQPLLEQAKTLAAAVQELKDPEAARRLHRDLSEAMMEALYAVEGKAMSMRLNRYKTTGGE